MKRWILSRLFCGVVALGFVAAVDAGAAEPASSEATPSTLEDILAVVGGRPSDVGLRPDAIAQPYVLPWAARLLTDPLTNVATTQAWAEDVLRNQPDTAAVLASLAGPADVALPGVSVAVSSEALAASARALPADLPDWLKPPLARFLWEISEATAAVRRVHASVSETERRELDQEVNGLLSEFLPEEPPENDESSVKKNLRRIGLLGRVPRADVLDAARHAARATRVLRDALLAHRDAFGAVSGRRFETPLGPVTLGGVGDDVRVLEPSDLLVIDFGGEDVYRGAPALGSDGRLSILLDLAGDDVYNSTRAFGMGGGHWGVGVLWDAAGEDRYDAPSYAMGCGIFGAGVLVDEGGDDVYNAGTVAQGAALWGVGVLSDFTGEDLYRLDRYGQGFAGAGGVGLLLEGGGNDQYLAGNKQADPREPGVFQSMSQGFAIGLRDYAGGGVGALLDGAGHDFYRADYFGQGSSYWLSLGLLYDRRGRDTYVARRYAQGAGVHFSAGLLLDASDDDTYYNWGGGQGLGWDYGVGVLLDERGNDVYHADWNSQGGGGANGWGVFVDNAGDDLYYVRDDHGQGVGIWDERRHAPSLGLFVDAGGSDRYPEAGREGGLWNTASWGVGVDAAARPLGGLALDTVFPPAPPDLGAQQEAHERGRLEKRLARARTLKDPSLRASELIEIAGYWGLDAKTPLAAKKLLLTTPPDQLYPAVLDSLDCRLTLGYMAQEEIHLRFGRSAVEALLARAGTWPAASDDGSSPAPWTPALREKRFGIYYLGQTASTQSVRYLLETVDAPSWRDRASAAGALGKIFDGDLVERARSLQAFLLAKKKPGGKKDFLAWLKTVPYADRLRLIVPLQPLTNATFDRLMEPAEKKGDAWDEAWLKFLIEKKPAVLKALDGRLRLQTPPGVIDALRRRLDDPHEAVRQTAVTALGGLGRPDAAPWLLPALSDERSVVRDAASWALGAMGPDVQPLLREVLASTSPLTRSAALWALQGSGGAEVLPTVAAALKDPDWPVRTRALEILWVNRETYYALSKKDGNGLADFRKTLSEFRDAETNPWVKSKAQTCLRRLAQVDYP